MKPKEKASELVNKFYIQEIKYYENIITAKECATIAVDEILRIEAFSLLNSTLEYEINYWEEVKKEIEKL